MDMILKGLTYFVQDLQVEDEQPLCTLRPLHLVTVGCPDQLHLVEIN